MTAVHKDTKIVIVGDPEQLPSIRPGELLVNILKICESFPEDYVVRLTKIMRQKEIEGRIPAIVSLSKSLISSVKENNPSILNRMVYDNLEEGVVYPDLLLGVFKKNARAYDEVKILKKVFESLLENDSIKVEEFNSSFKTSINFKELQENKFFDLFSSGNWQVITPFRKSGQGKLGSEELNLIARRYINGQNYDQLRAWSKKRLKNLGYMYKKLSWKYNSDKMFAIGDKIICSSNIYKPQILHLTGTTLMEQAKLLGFPVVNGDIGIVEEMYTSDPDESYGKKISYTMEEIPEVYRSSNLIQMYSPFYKVKIEGKPGYVWFNAFDVKNIELGYVFTIHKSQGSEYDSLLIIVPNRAKSFVTPRMLYTAITRAKKKLCIISSEDVLENIIVTKDKDVRFTNIEQVSNLEDDRINSEGSEDLQRLLKIYTNWVNIIRKKFIDSIGEDIKPFEFILKIMDKTLLSMGEGDSDEEEQESTETEEED
jgi:ATP-dependent exoDNAse (exonuclease V) alpha subunit